MRICVMGSIATDHLMTFEGRFAESLVADQLANLSVSFLVNDLQVRRGGTGANIAFGLGSLGLDPVLVGGVGADFAEYRGWLDSHGVETGAIRTSATEHTARFTCTTDQDANQIASFYPGAMGESGNIGLAEVAEQYGPFAIAIISADDPDGMMRHTNECRELGVPFVADISQQLAFSSGEAIRDLVDGAAYLFTNEYEAALIEQKTGWSAQDILDRVGIRVTTLAEKGCRIESKDSAAIAVAAVKISGIVDPTGVGDAFRSGFLAGTGWGLGSERSAQIGATLAAYVIETIGPQEYAINAQDFIARFTDAYGIEAAGDVTPHLSAIPSR